ncbi:MAG: YchJ family protein [Bacteriovoracaceae bacterium]|nr:YchJ family protein [Bacteriovoracaceae bacterium]
MSCPCGTEKAYEECCELLHEGKAKAQSAEQLMRSRYSAFVKQKINYIGETHIPGTTDFDASEAEQWANQSIWKGLEIVKTQLGEEKDQTGVVEFKALYSDQKEENNFLHHEVAKFKKIEDVWYYEDGQIVGHEPLKRATPKVGRNEPCVCGSGKKFKKCCGK